MGRDRAEQGFRFAARLLKGEFDKSIIAIFCFVKKKNKKAGQSHEPWG